MALTLANMATRVLRNIQLPQLGLTSDVQATADAKQYLNERVREVWDRRLWREYIVTGSFSVPANTSFVALSSIALDGNQAASGKGFNASIYEVTGLYQGTTVLIPMDPGEVNKVDPTLWTNTNPPIWFINLGQNGIRLLGQYSTATIVNFQCKANYQDIADDGIDTWILDPWGKALIAGATADLIRDHDRDGNRSNARYQEYELEVVKLINRQEVQGANIKKVVPVNAWTGDPIRNILETSKIGITSPL